MIIRIMTLLVLISCSEPCQAQDPQEHSDSGNQKQATLPQEQTAGQEQLPSWPLPFNPSQEIGADSQVSFPTDI